MSDYMGSTGIETGKKKGASGAMEFGNSLKLAIM